MNENRQENPAMDMEAASASPVETIGTADTGTTAGTEEDILLPDGWTGKEFPVTDEDPLGMGPASGTSADAGTDGGTDSGSDTPQTAEESGQQSGTGDKTDAAPETAAVRQQPEQTAQTETPDKPAGGEETPDGQEPDYKALWLAHEEEQNAAHFRQVYQSQREAGMTEEAARLIAASECGGKSYPVDGTAAGTSGTAEAGQDSGIDAQLRRLHIIFPNAREIPRAVMQRVKAGENLVDAYISNELSAKDATIAAQKKEIETLRQNASNREKAVATGVSGQGMKVEAPDEFMQGFLSEA